MVRTQIYLTRRERDGLAALSLASGRKYSDLIREALDRFLSQSAAVCRRQALARAAGMWKKRTDLPSARSLRASWHRG